ncbi:unnamed protein product [Blepharisma stoltei]|uniref:Uncharacterized protein n=1 Tax=Blepharisma stoltei TaxID=1481888 RepID=A0AAU9JNM3_9CILI|nr:unnamed protein product [Blepharisma stoltei]
MTFFRPNSCNLNFIFGNYNISLQKNSKHCLEIYINSWVYCYSNDRLDSSKEKISKFTFRKTVKNTIILFKFAFTFRGKSSKIAPLKSVE